MAICTFCGLNDPPANTNRDHYYIPWMGCIIKIKAPPLPTCT